MKVAMTLMGTDLDIQIDPRFGRYAYLLFVPSVMLTNNIQLFD